MTASVGIDWAHGSEGPIQRVRNEPRSVAELVRHLVSLDADRIVVESTGGYERPLVEKLAAAGLPVVVVNPRRVRSFGEGMGMLAKTDPSMLGCSLSLARRCSRRFARSGRVETAYWPIWSRAGASSWPWS
jgi:hypothetical protein